MDRQRDILERAVHTVAEQGGKAGNLVDEAIAAAGGSHPAVGGRCNAGEQHRWCLSSARELRRDSYPVKTLHGGG